MRPMTFLLVRRGGCRPAVTEAEPSLRTWWFGRRSGWCSGSIDHRDLAGQRLGRDTKVIAAVTGTFRGLIFTVFRVIGDITCV